VRALDSEAGENVVKWCPGGCRMGQKSPIEVQHAQKTTDLTNGPVRVVVLELE
jgi:hypothetical protein